MIIYMCDINEELYGVVPVGLNNIQYDIFDSANCDSFRLIDLKTGLVKKIVSKDNLEIELPRGRGIRSNLAIDDLTGEFYCRLFDNYFPLPSDSKGFSNKYYSVIIKNNGMSFCIKYRKNTSNKNYLESIYVNLSNSFYRLDFINGYFCYDDKDIMIMFDTLRLGAYWYDCDVLHVALSVSSSFKNAIIVCEFTNQRGTLVRYSKDSWRQLNTMEVLKPKASVSSIESHLCKCKLVKDEAF